MYIVRPSRAALVCPGVLEDFGIRQVDKRSVDFSRKSSKMLLWPAFWNDLQDPLETRETGKYCNYAARARTRSTVLEVLKKTSTRNDEACEILVVETDGRSNDQAKYPPKRYVYSEILVFANEKTSTRNNEAYEILVFEKKTSSGNTRRSLRG